MIYEYICVNITYVLKNVYQGFSDYLKCQIYKNIFHLKMIYITLNMTILFFMIKGFHDIDIYMTYAIILNLVLILKIITGL